MPYRRRDGRERGRNWSHGSRRITPEPSGHLPGTSRLAGRAVTPGVKDRSLIASMTMVASVAFVPAVRAGCWAGWIDWASSSSPSPRCRRHRAVTEPDQAER
jgi:hypothetical protein